MARRGWTTLAGGLIGFKCFGNATTPKVIRHLGCDCLRTALAGGLGVAPSTYVRRRWMPLVVRRWSFGDGDDAKGGELGTDRRPAGLLSVCRTALEALHFGREQVVLYTVDRETRARACAS